jgi:hypothetical protein
MNAPLENLQVLLREDKVIPVIGAGVSYAAANLPGWKATIENGLQFAEMHRLDSDQIHAARKQLNGGNLIEGADIMKALLGAPSHPFSNWLKDLFGEPVVRSPDLLNSIEDLCAPILLTTNYDKLLSARSRLRTREVFDWSEYEEVHGALSHDPRFILHLHGIWNKPETIVLSKADYANLAKELGYKELLKKLWTDYHFLFIGCSRDGVMDEDFSTVFGFLNEWFPGRTHQHFILLNERDIEGKAHLPLLKQCNVAPISYGHDYSKLAEFINCLNPNRERARRETEELKKEIEARVGRLKLSDVKYSGNDAETRQLIKEVLPAGAYWIDSLQLKLLENALRETNNSIQNKREQFRFSQGVVKALVEMGELESQLQLWSENRDNPSSLNNDKFINLAIICYECLQRLPQDLLEEIRHRAPWAIHPYYFDGYLGRFVSEYRMFKDRFRDDYNDDKYFFENLKRIIDSLRGLLKLDADVIFTEIAPAMIAEQIERPGWLFVCADEVSLRKPLFPYERVAWLPAQGKLGFRDAIIIRFQEEWVVVACNSQKCFRWNPTKHLAAEPFFEAPPGESIRNLFVTETTRDRVVVVVYCGSTLYNFLNFEASKETSLSTKFHDLVYHSASDAFFCFNLLGSIGNSPVLYRVDWDGSCQPLIYSDTIWSAIEHLPACVSLGFDFGDGSVMGFNGGLMRLRKWGDREVVAVKLNFVKLRGNADLLAFIDVEKLVPEFLALVVLPGRLCIAFDLMQKGESMDLVCGYLSTGEHPKHLVQWIKGIDRHEAIQADDSYSYIETGVSARFDIIDVWNHSGDWVFVNQPHNGTLFDLNLSDGSFEKLSLDGLIKILPF